MSLLTEGKKDDQIDILNYNLLIDRLMYLLA